MKITQREAAKITGLDEGTISRLVKYGEPIGLDVVIAIHRGLHVDANRLLDVDPPKEFMIAKE